MKVAFLHPDLGLGGAERLVVDAAVELVKLGQTVDIYTAHYDPGRCFEETRTGMFGIFVFGSWLPRNVLGRLHALCAYLRCMVVAMHMVALSIWGTRSYDVVIVDQVSAAVPVLRLMPGVKILFYCHFPDLLLAQHSTLLRRMYRGPIDWLEETTTGMADLLLVNSGFTQTVFAETFKRLHRQGVLPGVLYPAVSIPSDLQLEEAEASWHELPEDVRRLIQVGTTFLSINRFEVKKGIPLALQALQALHQREPGSPARLVIAGGYDIRVQENVNHYAELKRLVESLQLQDKVAFLPSFTDRQRSLLLSSCTAVLYTPQNEHFGIVPLEAMAAGRPVIACNSGGPMESVMDDTTGFLREPSADQWSLAMAHLMDSQKAKEMGQKARQHVKEKFSREAFGRALNEYLLSLTCKDKDE